MRIFSTAVHGVVDYLLGVLLIVSPWLLGFALNGPETWTAVLMGAAIIVYSLLTDYELGVVRRIDMRAHLTLDAISGVILMLAPWLLLFAHIVWAPYFVFGLVAIVIAFTTDTVTSYAYRSNSHVP